MYVNKTIEIEKNTCTVELDGVEKNVRFELLSNEMKLGESSLGESSVSQHPIFLHLQMSIKLVLLIWQGGSALNLTASCSLGNTVKFSSFICMHVIFLEFYKLSIVVKRLEQVMNKCCINNNYCCCCYYSIISISISINIIIIIIITIVPESYLRDYISLMYPG